MLCMEYAQQLVFLNHEKCGWCNGCSRPHPNRLARHAALAKKITWAKHRDYRFSSGSVYHGKFHASPLDVHDAIRSLALRVDRFVSPKFCNFSRHAGGVEENLRVERETNRSTRKARLRIDRKSTRLNSSHVATSYAVFC